MMTSWEVISVGCWRISVHTDISDKGERMDKSFWDEAVLEFPVRWKWSLRDL